MRLIFTLKILTDLCYFMFAISSVASCFAHSGLLLTSPAIMAISAYFSAMAAEKQPKRPYLRFLPLVICLGAFIFASTAADWVVTIPMIGYLAFTVRRNSFGVSYDQTQENFYTCLKIIPVVAIITIVASNRDGFLEVMLPYFFMFLILTIMLLRMLRHSAEVFQDSKFRILNTVEIALVCGMGYLLSSGYIMKALGFVGTLVMNYVLRPIFSGALYIFGGVVWLFRKLFSGVDINLDDIDFTELEEGLGQGVEAGEQEIMDFYAEEAANSDSQALTYIAIAVGAIVMIVLVVVLFRILMKAGRRAESNTFGDVREAIDDDAGSDQKLTRTPRDRVRSCYRRFLKMCVRSGLDPDLNLNSFEVNQAMRRNFDDAAMEGLRGVYIRARYSSGEITEDDVKTARQMLDKAKKAEKETEKRRAKVDRSTGA